MELRSVERLKFSFLKESLIFLESELLESLSDLIQSCSFVSSLNLMRLMDWAVKLDNAHFKFFLSRLKAHRNSSDSESS